MRSTSHGQAGWRRVGRVLTAGLVAIALLTGAGARAQVAAPTPDVDERAMLRDLQLLSADGMEGRAAGTAGNGRARALLIDRFRRSGLQMFGGGFEHPFAINTGTKQGVNIVGYITGTQTPTRYIVVSAHYDHIGVRNGRVFNGANDNASGAAALPAIAAYFRQHPPATSMIFVAFDAEEDGLLGARAFVRAPPVDAAAIVMNLNLDMIGRDPANTLYVAGTRQFPVLRPLVQEVAETAKVTLKLGFDDPQRGRDNWTRDSDQWAFMEAGIPALYVGVEDYALHHNADDDYATMTLDFYVRAVDTTIRMIERFDRSADAIAAARR